jgi:RNA polymerase sigma-70 factor (ECF subfamily)
MATRAVDSVLNHLHQLIGLRAAEHLTDSQLLERFVARHEEAAFAELVQRHGRLVLSVCRRLLRQAPDAEDAFQATFLVLAQRAASIRKRESLASWLYGVAYRIAVKAKEAGARREEHEREAGAMRTISAGDPARTVLERELQEVVDAELDQLPEKYRAPLILCGLEGKTQDEAARELGWPVGSMSRRLTRGRELLRQRLARRGITAAPGVLLTTFTESSATAALPANLVGSTVKTALLMATGQAAMAGLVSAQAFYLADRVIKAMFVTKLKIVAALVLVSAAVGGGAGILTHRTLAAPLADAPKNTPAQAKTETTAADFPPGPPQMVLQGQKPLPQGGRVVLYSRARYGNYPLATYAFHLGLRGDDASVSNEVNLIFGNGKRKNGFAGPPVDAVPGVRPRCGAAGMDGGPPDHDTFRVNCWGGAQNCVVDLGPVDYAAITQAPESVQKMDGRDADRVPVKVNDTYVIRLLQPGLPQLQEARFVKLKVLGHRDFDAVQFEWAWIRPPAMALEQLLSDDVETYLAGRANLLAQGLASKPLVEKQLQLLPTGADERLRLRLVALLADLNYQEAKVRRIRIIDAGLRRVAEVRKSSGRQKIILLFARWVTPDPYINVGNGAYRDMCHFSFPREKYCCDGTQSLEFGDGSSPDNSFYPVTIVGSQNRIKDLGAVDFSKIKTAPSAATTATWQGGRVRIKPEVGHVYLEHCLDPRYQVDMTVKFKVLELKPDEWVILEWELIPQEK